MCGADLMVMRPGLAMCRLWDSPSMSISECFGIPCSALGGRFGFFFFSVPMRVEGMTRPRRWPGGGGFNKNRGRGGYQRRRRRRGKDAGGMSVGRGGGAKCFFFGAEMPTKSTHSISSSKRPCFDPGCKHSTDLGFLAVANGSHTLHEILGPRVSGTCRRLFYFPGLQCDDKVMKR